MRSLFVIRIGRREWHVLPRVAVRSSIISVGMVVAALFVIDRLALPMLERRGLTAGADWQRHNALVVAEHRAKDTTDSGGDAVPIATRFSVRSWRGHPVERRTQPRQPNDRVRLLVMGDSYVWGSPYLTLNHMWWRQLETELVARGYDVEVIAAGQSGASTRDQLAVARRVIPEYHPDLILWGYVTNDADEGLVRQISQSQQSLPGFNRLRDAAALVWPRLVAKFNALRAHKLAKSYTGPKYGYEYGEWELKLVEPTNLAVYAETVRSVKELMTQHKLPGCMMTLPSYPSTKHFAPRLDPVVPVWRDAGVPTFNVLPTFVARYGEVADAGADAIAWGINPADGHPGPRACRFLAQQAAKIVEDHFRESLEKGRTGRIYEWKLNDSLPADLNVSPLPITSEEIRRRRISTFPNGAWSWTLTYPSDDSRLPFMPDGVPTVLLSLREPESVGEIRLEGDDLISARVWVETCPEYGMSLRERVASVPLQDDFVWRDLGVVSRTKPLTWMTPFTRKMLQAGFGRRVSAVRFRADFGGSDRRLKVTLREISPLERDVP